MPNENSTYEEISNLSCIDIVILEVYKYYTRILLFNAIGEEK